MTTKVNFRKASFEFLSIVVAVVLAMALTEWRQDYLNRKLAQQSLNNIIEEVQENRRELIADSTRISADLRSMNKWLSDYFNNAPRENFSNSFSYSFLSKSALEVAKINNSLTYLPNEVNMDIAEIYATQDFYSENGIKLFDIMGSMKRRKGTEESMGDFVDQVDQMRFHLALVRDTIRAYLEETEDFLSNQGVSLTSD